MKTLSEIIQELNLVTDKNSLHSYCDYFYEDRFADFREQPVDVLEIGIDQGGSLILWANYFTNSSTNILGLDLEFRGNCQTDCGQYSNIAIQLADAYSPTTADKFGMFDIIIDDGPHTLSSQITAIELYFPKLKPGGIFMIEDVPDETWISELTQHVPAELQQYIEVVDLRKIKGRSDDLMFVVKRS